MEGNAPLAKGAAESCALRVVDEENCAAWVSAVPWQQGDVELTDLMETSSSRRRPRPMVRLVHCIPLLGIMAGCRRRYADKGHTVSPRYILRFLGCISVRAQNVTRLLGIYVLMKPHQICITFEGQIVKQKVNPNSSIGLYFYRAFRCPRIRSYSIMFPVLQVHPGRLKKKAQHAGL